LEPAVTKKFDALTGARWMFASFVFVYHNRKYWREDINKYLLQFINELHVGVSLFFVLSGFLIAYKYNSPQHKGAFRYGQYIGLRLARILPVYWLILLASYIDWGFPNTYKSVITFSLLHGFSNIHNLDGIAQAWSLTVELSFYFLAPLLFLLWNKSAGRAIGCLLISFVLVVAAGLLWHKINGNKDEYLYPFSFVLHSTFFGRITEFAAGIYLAGILHKKHPDPFRRLNHLTYIGFAGIVISLFIIGFFQPDIFHHGYDTAAGSMLQFTLIPIFTITWFYGLICEQTWMSKILSSRLFILLGNASFAFYLVHISYVNIRLQGWHFFPDRNYILLWLVAIALYLLFEKPINDLFRKILKKKNKPAAANYRS
jgi:peptidoglycan/LPS O-acetylase OafA/YrhL